MIRAVSALPTAWIFSVFWQSRKSIAFSNSLQTAFAFEVSAEYRHILRTASHLASSHSAERFKIVAIAVHGVDVARRETYFEPEPERNFDAAHLVAGGFDCRPSIGVERNEFPAVERNLHVVGSVDVSVGGVEVRKQRAHIKLVLLCFGRERHPLRNRAGLKFDVRRVFVFLPRRADVGDVFADVILACLLDVLGRIESAELGDKFVG